MAQLSFAQDQPILQTYTIEQGLPNSWVRVAVQDDVGFMWFATLDGLARFDGYNFKLFPYQNNNRNAIDSDRVQSLAMDNNGHLWVSRYFWPLEWYNPKTEESKSYFSSDENMVTDIYSDPPHHIWLGYGDGGVLKRVNTTNHITVDYRVEPDSVEGAGINDIHRDLGGNLWIATNYGLYLFDSLNLSFTRYRYLNHSSNVNTEYYENIDDLVPGKLILETGQGPMTFDISSKQFESILEFDYHLPVSLGNFTIRKGRYVWIGYQPSQSNQATTTPTGGLIKYNLNTGSTTLYPLEAQIPLLLDRSGNIWVHSKTNGIRSFKPEQRKFRGYQWPSIDNKIKGDLSASLQDLDKFLWIGTNMGLYKLDFDRENRLGVLEDYSTMIKGKVNCLFQSSDRLIWIGTSRGVYLYSPDSQVLKKYSFNPGHLAVLPNGFEAEVFDILEDQSGTIWFTGPGLAQLNRKTGSLKFYDNPTDRHLHGVQEDSYGNLWFPDSPGNLVVFDRTKEQYHIFKIAYSELLRDLFIDDSGTIWIGAATGLYSFKTKPLDSLVSSGLEVKNHNQLLKNDYVAEIQGHSNSIWVRHVRGLTKINPLTQEVEYFDKYDGIQESVWSAWSNSFKNDDNELFFFWGNSLNIFHPDSILYNEYIPPIVLTDFQIFNKSFEIGDSLEGKPILTQAIYHTQSITLPPGQTFSFEFAALDYTNPKENLYSYKMEGLDEDWSPPGHQRTTTYTNLWEGVYTFRVKGSNNDGYWNEAEISIEITIMPPWYRSKLAYGIYGGLLIMGLVLGRRLIIQKERVKAQTQLKLLELEKAKEIDQAKTQFFANISHEFRTPLTLILGPIKQMYDGTFTGDKHTVLGVVIRNSKRLLHLVNQLLDFSKLEAGGVTLQASIGDLVEFMKSMFSTFESTAQQRNITYMFQSNVSNLPAYFDRDKLEKVIINLLSNAFKFTKSNDTINLKMIKKDSHSPADYGDGVAEIIIEDTGKGIPSEKLPYVFDRFYQADHSYTRQQEGTGIGLALAKELVELHHGSISAASKKGKGATFIIQLPLGKSHLKAHEMVIQTPFKPIDITVQESLIEDSVLQSNPEILNGDLPILLIVEDNADMRLYLKEILSDTYQIAETADGLAGFDYAQEHTPDLIISDVMMPGMDGHELCSRLKTDERTSHIPIVLLTARAGEEAKIEGLETGADDYITKPFSPVELKARVQNLIELRQKLRERFGNIVTLKPADISVKSVDERFIKRALEILEIHRTDTEFDSDKYAREMGMSRSQLHRKLKALTNQSIGVFIRLYRLNYARTLIEQNFGDIAQVSYECGFSSPSYFTECFKKEFGLLPSKVAKAN
ncbi:MAG: hybrid sensor histidine kinase/response regulator [Cyclobacteriaceae bacterium]|nr:MAG: hybrid sensor histidine kinase/response regulator [Cyclobacteriaceae bacterium]